MLIGYFIGVKSGNYIDRCITFLDNSQEALKPYGMC